MTGSRFAGLVAALALVAATASARELRATQTVGQALGGYPPPPRPFDGRAEALQFFLFAPFGATQSVTVPPFPPPGPPSPPSPPPPLYIVVNLGKGATSSSTSTSTAETTTVVKTVSPSPSPAPTGVVISLEELISSNSTEAISNIVTVVTSLNETAIALLGDYLLGSATTDCDLLASVFVNATTVAVADDKGDEFWKGYQVLEADAGTDWPSCLDATTTKVQAIVEKADIAAASTSPAASPSPDTSVATSLATVSG